MTNNYPGERWKAVGFDFDFTNDFRIEVSNFGRLRTFNKISDGNLISGSLTGGYRIVRLKLYKPRDEQAQQKLDSLTKQILKLSTKIKIQARSNDPGQAISKTTQQLNELKDKRSSLFRQNLKERTINYHSLIHRLVAQYFLPKPTANQTIVGHLDHDKLNNRTGNLKWMTPAENYAHQKTSPSVIEEKEKRQQRQQSNPNRAKLTVTKVMLLKKLLNEGKTVKQLSRIFKVTDTQIIRIKRGENWANIPASR